MLTPLFINIGAQEIFILLLGIPVLLAYLYCIYHALTNRRLELSYRLLWTLAMFALPFLGCALYWTVGKKDDDKK